jgi:hypothetical protein
MDQQTASATLQGPVTLFTTSWKLFTENWKILVPIFIIPTAISYVGNALTFAHNPFLMVISVICAIVAVVAGIAAVPAGINAISKVSGGATEQVTIKGQYRFGFGLFGSYLLVAIIAGLVITGSSALFIIPGVIVGGYMSLYLFTLVIDGKKGFSALTESYGLVKDRWMPVVGRILFLILVLVVVQIIASGLTFVISLLLGMEPSTFFGARTASGSFLTFLVSSIVSILANAVIAPLSTVYTYGLYTNLKATRPVSPDVSAFKKWSIAFLCIGIVSLVALFVAVPLILRSLQSVSSAADPISGTRLIQDQLLQIEK